MEDIAREPETQLVSSHADGGSPAGISAFVTKILCHNLTAGSVPVLSTYLMHPVLGECVSQSDRRVHAAVRAARECDGSGHEFPAGRISA